MSGAHANQEDCVTDEEIARYLTGRLDDEEVNILMRKINSCVYCKRKLILAPDLKLDPSS